MICYERNNALRENVERLKGRHRRGDQRTTNVRGNGEQLLDIAI